MYGFHKTLSGVSVEEAVDKVTAALKTEGFGVLTDINVQAVMKEKLDIDHKPYRILGACNPTLAHQAIEHDSDIGLLLPCNVVVREEDNAEITVAFVNPKAMLQVVNDSAVDALATEVEQRLHRVSDSL